MNSKNGKKKDRKICRESRNKKKSKEFVKNSKEKKHNNKST